jgi:hypothetical protein
MSKILPEEELDLSDQPLHEGTPVFPPEGLTMKQFSDLVMMCEYLWHYGELLYQDDSQGRPPTVESLSNALTTGIEGFPVLASVMVSFLQLLLQDMPVSHHNLSSIITKRNIYLNRLVASCHCDMLVQFISLIDECVASHLVLN